MRCKVGESPDGVGDKLFKSLFINGFKVILLIRSESGFSHESPKIAGKRADVLAVSSSGLVMPGVDDPRAAFAPLSYWHAEKEWCCCGSGFHFAEAQKRIGYLFAQRGFSDQRTQWYRLLYSRDP